MFRKCILLITLFGCSYTLFKNKIGSPQRCPQDFTNLLNLFTVMCNNIANGTNVTLRDGCIGCFQSASNVNNQPSLSAITSCASTYLVNSNYSTCFNLPQVEVDNGIDPRSMDKCVTGYCGYVRCIRSVNSNILISTCYNEATGLTNDTYPNQQVDLYKNITSCILARSRCSTINPITGRSQNGRFQSTKFVDKFGKVSIKTTGYYYSLQITSTGELRIIGLPDSISIQKDFCSTQNNLNEASWLNYTC